MQLHPKEKFLSTCSYGCLHHNPFSIQSITIANKDPAPTLHHRPLVLVSLPQVRDYAGVHAVEAVLEAMRDYPDHLGVMGAAAQALANLVALNHAGHQRAALVGGGAEAILGLLAHLNRIGSSRTEQVAKAALRAIRNLGASDETAGRLLSEGVQERVFKCMDVHAFSPAVVEVACQAIANLAVAGATDDGYFD